MPDRPVILKLPFHKLSYGLMGFFFICLFPLWAAADQGSRHFKALKSRLIRSGFDESRIHTFYHHPSVRFDPASVAFFFVYKEARLNYEQFAEPDQIQKARRYMQKQSLHLSRAEEKFGVEREIITAIILVETRLGTYTGGSRVLNTLSTIAALADPLAREALWNEITKKRKVSRKGFEKRADRKAKWAFAELKAFLRYTAKEEITPAKVRGSLAGALGISQFMPSNILVYGRVGNDDGRVNLFEHADAIASIANYLRQYGWRPGISRDKAYKVVWKYNHSKYYVNIVLKVARMLKG